MIESKTIKTLLCDGCGAKGECEEIRSYAFLHQEYDGHRDEWTESSVELCRRCQNVMFEKIKEAVTAIGKKQ